MFKTKLLLAALCATSLAGCMQDPASRGVGGAVAGAVLADALDENIIAGAALGGLAGAATCGINLGLPACDQGF
jgi:osmotically inducible lipoprotein OsmB